ncbi:class I SAM-dependent methyltransferase [Streptosporangium saharense]|uniref:class I SAM-dependent methyltransferase n=1 Tax=Streptosporangium saharense TaxID=1706840 RepID=UPI0034492DE4
MRRSRKVITSILCVLAVLTGDLTIPAADAGTAVPNRWGFALVNTQNGVPTLARQAGSWTPGPVVTVLTPAGGPTYVRFPRLATTGGVVHVTAVSPRPEWCQALRWGPSGADLLVTVRCHRYGGAPVTVPFTVLFEQSTGRLPAPKAFGYVHHDGTAVVSRFNSSGGANTVTAGPTGTWDVFLPGLGSARRAGGAQVTAVDPVRPARCKIATWTSTAAGQNIRVRCHDARDTPIGTGWTLTYQRERAITGTALPSRKFAYTFDNLPADAGPYSPSPARVNHNSHSAVNTLRSVGAGLRLVTFPQVGGLLDHVQVTAYGPGPEYCNLLTPWNTGALAVTVRDVACYNGLARTAQAFLVTYASAG